MHFGVQNRNFLHECARWSNFFVDCDAITIGDYDYDSIMHYGWWYFGKTDSEFRVLYSGGDTPRRCDGKKAGVVEHFLHQ